MTDNGNSRFLFIFILHTFLRQKKISKFPASSPRKSQPVVCRTPFGLPVLPEVYNMKRGSSLSIHSQSQVSDWSATNSEYQTSRWSTHMYLQQKGGWGVNLTQIFWERTRGTLEILHLISTPRKINGWNLKINLIEKENHLPSTSIFGFKILIFQGFRWCWTS